MEHLLKLSCGRVLTWILDGAKSSNWQCWLLFWHTPGRLTSHATVWFFKTYCCNASLKSDIFWRLLSRFQTQSLEYLELQLSRCWCCDMAHCRELHCSEFNDVRLNFTQHTMILITIKDLDSSELKKVLLHFVSLFIALLRHIFMMSEQWTLLEVKTQNF